MSLPWAKIFRYFGFAHYKSRQTYILFFGIILGYLGFVLWLHPRPLVILSGGMITLLVLLSWPWQFAEVSQQGGPIDFLNQEQFNAQLSDLETLLLAPHDQVWRNARLWAHQSQVFAQNIWQKEESLMPELVETLYTVMDLATQIVEALNVKDQIQTPIYQEMAAQRLANIAHRLEQTYLQLQELQDQVTIASLDQKPVLKSALPQRLEILISANKTILNSPNIE